MNYSPLNIQNKNLLKSDWLIKQKTEYTYLVSAPIKEEYLRPFVPAHFQIDKFDNGALVSLVIIKNQSLAFKYLPFIKNRNTFHVYLRTYILRNEVPGYFYIDIDTNHKKLNHILKTLTELPLNDASIKETSDFGNTQIDLIGNKLKLYANLEKTSERILPETDKKLHWMQNRFNIYNLQKGQVINWKIDFSPDKVWQAYIANIQVSHSSFPLESITFNQSGYFLGANTFRIWPPSLL